MRTAKLWLHIALCLLVLWASLAVAQDTSNDQGPDLINTLGVGARAIAMGDAYTAIADDPSATFWNPARLGEIPFLQVMVEGRNVLRITQVSGAPLPDYWDPTNTENNGITRLPMKFSFAGFSKSLGDWEPNVGSRGGTVGVSYSLGGYFDYRSRYNLPGEPINGLDSISVFQEDRLVENHFLTVAWGKNLLIARNPSKPRVARATPPAPAPAPAPLAAGSGEPIASPMVASPGTDFIKGTDQRTTEIEARSKIAPEAITATGTGDDPFGSGRRIPAVATQQTPTPAGTNAVNPQPTVVEVAAAPTARAESPAAAGERKGNIYKIGIGVGAYAVQQTQEKRSATVVETVGPGGELTVVPGTELVIPPLNASGTGYGFIVGLTGEVWGYRTSQGDEILPEGGRLRYGATYRSKAEIGGLLIKMPSEDFDMGDEFGREVPARITAGIAYEYTEPEASVAQSTKIRAPRQLTMSADVQHFGSANDTLFALDKRKAITNVGFGIEYIPSRQWLPIPFLRRLTYDEAKLAYVEPIRLGVRTNQAGNVYDIFKNDVVVSGGLALYYSALNGGARGNYTFSFEPTAEYFIESKQTIWTLSTNYRF